MDACVCVRAYVLCVRAFVCVPACTATPLYVACSHGCGRHRCIGIKRLTSIRSKIRFDSLFDNIGRHWFSRHIPTSAYGPDICETQH